MAGKKFGKSGGMLGSSSKGGIMKPGKGKSGSKLVSTPSNMAAVAK